MSITKPPILRAQIEEAQRHTKSNKQAAKYLGVSYPRYKRYAELYGLFESHKNVEGVGIDKGFSKRPTSIPLREILAGNHPTYSRRKLKNRLLARGHLKNQCSLCGFQEARIQDGQVPLMLSFKDGNTKHFALENLELLCYNCMFLTQGAPSAVYRQSIEKTLDGKPIKGQEILPTMADTYDPDDLTLYTLPVLSEEEKQALLDTL